MNNDEFDPILWKTHLLKHLFQEGPSDSVIGLFKIDFDGNGPLHRSHRVENLLDYNDVINSVSAWEKTALILTDDPGQIRSDSLHNDLSDDLHGDRAEAVGPELCNSFRTFNLWDEADKSAIEFFRKMPLIKRL